MSAKRIFYLVVVVLVAGVSALSGVVVGGAVVYQAVRQGQLPFQKPSSLATPLPASNSSSQTMTFSTTNVETAVTQPCQRCSHPAGRYHYKSG